MKKNWNKKFLTVGAIYSDCPQYILDAFHGGLKWLIPPDVEGKTFKFIRRAGRRMAQTIVRTWAIIDGVLCSCEMGYVWDGASVPWLFQFLAGHCFDSNLVSPSKWHDLFFQTKCVGLSYANYAFRMMVEQQGSVKASRQARVCRAGLLLGSWVAWFRQPKPDGTGWIHVWGNAA